MKTISWTEKVRNKEVSKRKARQAILVTMKKSNRYWFIILRDANESTVERKRQRKRRIQFLDSIKDKNRSARPGRLERA